MNQPISVSPESLCRSILEKNRDTISIRKPEVAVQKLMIITRSALKLSNRKGFQAMSLRDLSKDTGISMGGLYAYFDSKTTLLNMILTQVTLGVQDVLKSAPEEVEANPIEHLKWLIEHHIRLTEQMLPWFAFSFMEAKNFPAKERQMAVDSEMLTEGIFADATERAAAQGLLRPDLVPLLPALIKPLLQDWYVKRSKYRKKGVSVDDYINAVQTFVLNACLKQAPDIT